MIDSIKIGGGEAGRVRGGNVTATVRIYDIIRHESLFVYNLLALGNRNYNVMY